MNLEWGTPLAFLLLLPVGLLLLRRWLVGRNVLAVPRARSGQRGFTLRLLLAWVPSAFRLLGLVLVVIALARPRVVERETILESEGLDIMLAIDTSGSMRAEDFSIRGQPTNRLAVAKGVVSDFVKGRPHDRIGVVVFGEEAFTHVPLTLDHQTLIDVLDTVEIGIAGSRGTAIGTAVAVGARRLEKLDAEDRVLILLTDGQNNAGRLTPLEAAEAAAALGIKVYTVGVGADSGRSFFGMLRGADGIDEGTLKAVAEATGGRYFRATDTDSLAAIYATIGELEPSPAEVKVIGNPTELFRVPLIPAVLLLGLQAFLSATWLRRGP